MTEPASLDIPLLSLRHRHCREVTGTGDDGLALYCGHPKSGTTSYCAHHRRINLMMVIKPKSKHSSSERV
jgi:hypothetical protein